MKSTAFILMIITVVSKVLGFLKSVLLAKYFGTGMVADAFNFSLQIPTIIFAFIASGIATGFIPIYKKLEKEEGYLIANRFTSNLGNISIVIGIILLVFSEIFAGVLTKIYKFTPETHNLAVNFLRITLISLVATSISTVYQGYLHAKNKFIVPALQVFILNTFIIIAIILGAKINIYLLPIGLCIGTIVQYAPYIPAVKNTGFKWTAKIDLKDENIKRMIYLALPVIFGVSINSIGKLIDQGLATYYLSDGGLSIMYYGSQLSELVNAVVIGAVSTVAYTTLSSNAADGKISKFKNSILSSLNSMNILIYPAIVGLIIFARPIVNVVFNRGEWKPEATPLTILTLQFYSLGLVGIAFMNIFSKAFFSLRDTRTPTVNSLFTLVIDLVLSVLAANVIGLPGLALGTSLGSIIGAGMLIIRLRKKIGKFNGTKEFIIENLKMLAASLIMGLISYLVYGLLVDKLATILSLIAAIIVAVVVYFVLIHIFKVEELENIISGFKSKINNILKK
ncbi:murein biosynthesis integral membrane protein MurJ [Miniphocaeibacter halophilus]|uniref:Murein biosynthesis integral membrane protein MurJ n=1 Tax=Miniphocaeibacter halophilus TaxID=2931922 RepID=A0AC61MTX6_9FIRM|nr:murein biosynthesis integral membrane protein MurJ [Miniphocaeibacter halophilus]QQK08848.1 murein biosynthesis integral membrane protein MurJ [Miniphocaeibacter halophilus]